MFPLHSESEGDGSEVAVIVRGELRAAAASESNAQHGCKIADALHGIRTTISDE